MNEASTENEVGFSGTSAREFPSRRFGQRNTPLFVIRTIAIWTPVFLAAALMLTRKFAHQQPPDTTSVTGFVTLVFIAVAMQILTVKAWQKVDSRRVVWLRDEAHLQIYGHRIVCSFLSFGRDVAEISLPLNKIRSHSIVKGRGRFLRLHTDDGFLLISNDLDGFTELCEIVEHREDLVLEACHDETKTTRST